MPKYNGMVLADIHVGAFNLEKLHEEYLEMVIHHIKEMKSLDFLIVAGDFFDHKFYLNDKGSTVAYAMLQELLLACKEKETAVRFVYGTESHECDQYNILSLLKIYTNVEIIKFAKEEELLPGLQVLYLPEEYLMDSEKYYNKFFQNTKKYDYVFGHGVIREVMKEAVVHMENKETKNSKRKKVPIFSSAVLSRICKGQIFFGHYHINQNIDDKIFSIGSFSRWKFGEEGVKGYYELTCNTEKEKYKATHIENTMADTYTTIAYGYESNIFESSEDMNNVMNNMDKMIQNKIFDHVRFMINIPSDAENPESTINFLKGRYKFNEKVKVDFSHGYVEERKKQEKEKLKETNEKYAFINDESLSLEDKASHFIEITYNTSIPSNVINIYMNSPLKDILEMDQFNDENESDGLNNEECN